MGMTSKEKSKRYRERLKQDPEKYAQRKRKKRESYHKNKKLITDLKPQEKVNCRMIWKLRKQEQRKRKKAVQTLIANTPPSSPSILLLTPPGSPAVTLNSQNKTRGRKKVRRDRTILYRENKRLKQENEKLKRKYEKYKKRAQRNKKQFNKTHKIQAIQSTHDEPKKYKVLTNAIKDRYRSVHKNKEKTFLKKIFQKLETPVRKEIIKDTLGLEGNIRTRERDHRNDTLLKKKINDFFNRDDISRYTAGKKETIGRGTTKTQKRFLLDSMINLYRSFKSENQTVKCSYFYFTKNRPYYVVKPTIDGREMCLCKIHTNMAYKAKALRNKNVLDTFNLSSHILQTVCDTTNINCMLGTCKECKDKKIKLNTDKIQGNIKWFEWVREEEIYTKEGRQTKAIKNVKKVMEDTIQHLVSSFEENLNTLKKHVFNLKNQYRTFRQSVDNILPNEAVILVDFSENYNAKCSEEIQAHHFGGSRQQVTLHTVIVYVNNGENSHMALSFCTVSPCNIHQPAAIWAHLHPILINILTNYPAINTIHFFSDGPFSQYRQKANFFLSCTKIFDYGFAAFTWSYFEAGHGKGPADGVGGYLKRAADNLVATGKDITNAWEFYNALEGTSKVKLLFVPKVEIDIIQNQIPKNIVPLIGTIHVHQVFSKVRGQLKYRNLSCFCNRGICECLNPKIYHPIPASKKPPPKKNVIAQNDCNECSSDENEQIWLRSSNEQDISFKDLQRTRLGNIFKYVYGSSDTSDDDMDKNQQSCSKDINYKGQNISGRYLPGFKDNDHQQPSPLGLNNNLPGCDFPGPEDHGNQQPSTSGQINNLPGPGDYLLVKVYGAKGKSYTYVCVAQSEIEDDGEIKVTFLKAVKRGKLFVLDQKDVSYIAYDDIIKRLPNPDMECKRGEVYYKFSCKVDIFEK